MTTTTYDPSKKHPTMDEATIDEYCAILPYWVNNTPDGVDLVESLTTQYGFGTMLAMKGGIVSSTGTYSYPKDPDLYPLLRIDRVHETVFIYHYGIVSILYKDGRPSYTTRMD